MYTFTIICQDGQFNISLELAMRVPKFNAYIKKQYERDGGVFSNYTINLPEYKTMQIDAELANYLPAVSSYLSETTTVYDQFNKLEASDNKEN